MGGYSEYDSDLPGVFSKTQLLAVVGVVLGVLLVFFLLWYLDRPVLVEQFSGPVVEKFNLSRPGERLLYLAVQKSQQDRVPVEVSPTQFVKTEVGQVVEVAGWRRARDSVANVTYKLQ